MFFSELKSSLELKSRGDTNYIKIYSNAEEFFLGEGTEQNQNILKRNSFGLQTKTKLLRSNEWMDVTHKAFSHFCHGRKSGSTQS